jgi:hypothetical protein
MKDLRVIYILGIALLLSFTSYGVGMASNTCHTTLSNGSGDAFYRFCISNHGNVLNFEAPLGNDHITSEGYALCHNNVTTTDGYDTGGSESGCGNPTISQPNGANTLPLTITRTCSCIRFKQVFARDNVERDVTITMTITNVCGTTLQKVYVSRYFDGDIIGDVLSDSYDLSDNSVWAEDFFAISLTAVTYGTFHFTRVERFIDWAPRPGELQFVNLLRCPLSLLQPIGIQIMWAVSRIPWGI